MTNVFTPPARNYLKAIRLLAISTDGTYDIWNLAGPRKSADRVAIMSAIQGFRVPRAKAGITALRASLIDGSGVFGDSERARDLAFIEWARHHDAKAGA